MKIRLAKAMSNAGVCSRRGAETLIREGRVTVNGRIVTKQGAMVDPERDHIKVNGRLLKRPPPPVYILLNKPGGVVTTLHDPEGRPTVASLLKGIKPRIFPVGRMDYHTEGLLLLTNDGALAQKLMHPSTGIERTYLAKVKGIPSPRILMDLRRGVDVGHGLRFSASARLRKALKANAWLEITIREGQYREVRRICEAIGHPVIALRRVRFGPIRLDRLPRGRYRHLTPEEIKLLKRAARAV